jgi:hypothetical protein
LYTTLEITFFPIPVCFLSTVEFSKPWLNDEHENSKTYSLSSLENSNKTAAVFRDVFLLDESLAKYMHELLWVFM